MDYLSIGPVYSTTTKETARHPIGPEGVRSLRAQAGPDTVLVAAAGITLATAQEVLDAGASVIAVSAAIFCSPEPAAAFRRWLEYLALSLAESSTGKRRSQIREDNLFYFG